MEQFHSLAPRGRVLADELIRFLNYPGAAVLCGLMVVLSLYLTTTFLLTSAREWFTEHFQFARSLRDRWQAMRVRRNTARLSSELPASRRERSFASKGQEQKSSASAVSPAAPTDSRSLLNAFFGWFGRRKHSRDDLSIFPSGSPESPAEPVSVWQSMPRTMVDAPVAGPLSAATAAAAPFAAQLAAAAAPLRGPEPAVTEPVAEYVPLAAASVEDDWLNAPERQAPVPLLPAAGSRAKARRPADGGR